MHREEAIAAEARRLLGPGFAVVCQRTRPSDDHHLYQDEAEYIAGAAEDRRGQFATSRACARKALLELGVAPAAILPRADRTPVWPAGVLGSISHTRDWCIVAVTTRSDVVSVGLDLERNIELEPEVASLVCTPRELAVLSLLEPDTRATAATIMFSAKEALYKCQYPATQTFLDFLDVELDVNFGLGAFRATKVGSSDLRSNIALRIEGRFVRIGDDVISTALLRA